ncbi:MAG: hypothetical protein Q8N96_05220, partial [Methylovulum sp.]|nr:hypothetical protein [Methylovulum sp.]
QARSLGVFFAGIGILGGVAQSDAFASCAVWLWGFVHRWCPRMTQAANSVFDWHPLHSLALLSASV